jgi:hypothetical protein
MLTARADHASGTLVDSGTYKKIPVVAGGIDYHDIPFDSTEFLINEEWTLGKCQKRKKVSFSLFVCISILVDTSSDFLIKSEAG